MTSDEIEDAIAAHYVRVELTRAAVAWGAEKPRLPYLFHAPKSAIEEVIAQAIAASKAAGTHAEGAK